MPTPTTELVRRAEHLSTVSAWELLSRYATSHDSEAFAGLVRGFGPLVLGVCRRILGHSADADDAFQAVFIALSRRAGSFRDARALPAWLHRVAVRTAYKALARHRAEPTTLTGAVEPIDPADLFSGVTWRDVRRVLDEELDTLPEKYRGAVVLCWLDGLTQDEAAGRLGVSLNTLKRHLGAGRDLLRSRLTRRGLAPASAAAAVLDPTGLRSAVPDALATRAVEVGLPGGAVGPRVESLVTLTTPTRRVVLAGLLVGGAVAAGGLAHTLGNSRRPPAATPPPTPTDEKALPEPTKPLRFVRNGPAIRAGADSLVFTPDGKSLIANGRRPRVWNVTSGNELSAHPLATAEEFDEVAPAGIGMVREGKSLYGWNTSGETLLLWDVGTGLVRSVLLEPYIGIVWKAAMSPDGTTLAAAVRGGGVHIADVSELWTPTQGKPERYRRQTLRKTTTVLGTAETILEWPFSDLAFSPDGKTLVVPGRIATAGRPGAIQLWDVATRSLKATLPSSLRAQYLRLAFSPDGRYLAHQVSFATQGHELKVWDLAAGTERVLSTGKRLNTQPLAFHPDNRTLLGAWGEAITQWDVTTGENRSTLTVTGGCIRALAFRRDGTQLASASDGVDGDGKKNLPPTILLWQVGRTT